MGRDVVQVTWDGLDALRAELRRLPVHLTTEGGAIVRDTVARAKQDIVAQYPSRTGNLRKSVRVGPGHNVGRFGASLTLYTNAPIAWIYENGSLTRQTKLGSPNPMPATHVFVKAAMRARRAMYGRLKDLIARQGLEVSGDA